MRNSFIFFRLSYKYPAQLNADLLSYTEAVQADNQQLIGGDAIGVL